MTPDSFIRKWGDSTLRERQGAQSHFNDLCALLGEPTPTEDDPFGERYCFERGAEKVGGGDGWADGRLQRAPSTATGRRTRLRRAVTVQPSVCSTS